MATIIGFTFGKYIRLHRKDMSISLQKMAGDLEVSPSYINKIETKGEIPSADFIKKIAKYLFTEESDLLGLAFQDKIIATAKNLTEQYQLGNDFGHRLFELFHAVEATQK